MQVLPLVKPQILPGDHERHSAAFLSTLRIQLRSFGLSERLNWYGTDSQRLDLHDLLPQLRRGAQHRRQDGLRAQYRSS